MTFYITYVVLLFFYDRVAGSSTNQHVKNVRSDQAIKLTLKPTTKNQESLYANLDKSISSHSQKGMSRVELEEVKRMEKARQKVLLKNAQGKLYFTFLIRSISIFRDTHC